MLRQMMTNYIPSNKLTYKRQDKIWALVSLDKLSQAPK